MLSHRSTSLLAAASLLLAGGNHNLALADQSAKSEMNDFFVPTFTIAELSSGSRTNDLLQILATTGLFSVMVTAAPSDSSAFSSLRHDALSGLCDCMKSSNSERGAVGSTSQFLSRVQGSDTAILEDGSTRRTTLATATVGNTPLSLRTHELQDAGCTVSTIEAMDALRDQVAWVSHTFVQALDTVIKNRMGESREALLENIDGTAYMTLSSIVKASHNLEHFHLYEKPLKGPANKESSAPALDVHTDAGLFLTFVPGMSCDPSSSHDEAGDFFVQPTKNGPLQRAIFRQGSVAVMLGAGAEHWLRRIQTGPLEESHSPIVVNLRATRHAVTMPAGQSRAWYGMMHTVPADAIIQDFPKRTFSDMRQAMVLAGKTPRMYGAGQFQSGDDGQAGHVMAIGCGASSASELTLNGATRINRRRIQMVSDASVCNNVTNFFCWMSCLEIPEANSAAGFLTEGYSLYCLDPGTLAKTGNKVSAAQEVCNLNGVIGGAHQDSCLGSWQKTAPGVAYQEVSLTDPSLLAPQTEFCYGGTSMYMDGFHWTDPTCVIYLFPSWVLNSAGLLTGASIGTIIFAIALEAVIWQRRSIVPSCPEGWKRLGASTLFYGVQLTMGYLLMLVVMIYSGPLFFSVIMGLMIGHALFNGGGFKKPKRKSSDDYVDGTHENSSDGLERADKNGPSCCADGVKATEGLTPCCQNTL